ncbi:MAG: EamA family transporter [Boseongicola sp.]|nr:MAG: EamA family transporter [Boseongicola sp.]
MKRSDIALAVLVSFLWGLNFVVIEVGLESFPPLLFSAFRFSLAAIPLVFFVQKPDTSWGVILDVGFVLGVVKFSLLFVGMSIGASAGLASLVLQVQAIFTVLLAAFLLGEHSSKRQVAGIAIGFSGIALVGLTLQQSATQWGIAMIVLAGMAWAVSNLIIRHAGQAKMLNLVVWSSLIPPIPLLTLSLLIEGPEVGVEALQSMTLTGVAALFYIAFVSTIIGFAIWGHLIQRYGAGQVAPFSHLVPIFGMGSSALILGEAFGPWRILAAALIIFGLVLIVWKSTRAAPLRQTQLSG